MKKVVKITMLMVVLMGIIIVSYAMSLDNSIGTNAYINDWAILNKGQEVESIKGTAGIDINVIPAWEITKGESDIVIGVIDTGVDKTTYNLDKQLVSGWDFYNDDSSLYDDYLYDYHGTYICSTIAKISPGIKIMPVKFMESTSGSINDAVSAIEFAINNGAQIINCSWNFYDYNEQLYNVIADNPQVLFVCAAGNFNANIDDISIYPCSYDLDNIINVMAIDSNGDVYSTSGFGKTSVDIGSPGDNVKVFFPENKETFIGGTSVATAFVSSTAALVLSENPKLSSIEVKNIIIESAKPLDSLSDKCVSGGILDVYGALDKAKLKDKK